MAGVDIGDAHKRGISVEDLIDSSFAMPALVGADTGRWVKLGLEKLKELADKVELAQDRIEQCSILATAGSDDSTRTAIAMAFLLP